MRSPSSAPAAPLLRKHRSRVADVDRNDVAYTVRRGDVIFDDFLPRVKLSFADPASSIYFKKEAILSEYFSPIFHSIFVEDMANLTTSFVARGDGWTGERIVSIKFVRGQEPCVKPFPAASPMSRSVELKKGHFVDAAAVFKSKELKKHANTRFGRRLETAAMHASVTKPLPRSTRDVHALHWVCDWPSMWRNVQKSDKIYCTQWLDTHTHPAWYFPGAATTADDVFTLLYITLPKNTPMLRIARHSSGEKRVGLLEDGEWTHNEKEPTETELRLPPGRLTVLRSPTTETFYNSKVRLVQLVYRPWEYKVCARWSLKRSA